jgi:gas vesicle structural protein
MAIQQSGTSSISRAPRPSSLADVLDLILDKGLVIDAYVRVSVIGIEILTVDLRVVVASVDTYLRFAEAVNRLDLTQTGDNMTLEDLQRGGGEAVGRNKTEHALERAKDRVTGGGGDDDEKQKDGGGVRGAAERVKERVGGGRGQERREGSRGSRDRDQDQDGSRRERSEESDDDEHEENGGLRGLVGKVADRAKWS